MPIQPCLGSLRARLVCLLCLGLLFPWVGCLVLVSLEPVCAYLQHPSRTGFPLPDAITPCCKSILHCRQTIHAWFKWLVVFTGTLSLERCRCALWLHPPSKASPWVWLPSLWVPNFRCALDLQHSQSSRVTPEGCTGVWSPCRLQPCCLLLAGGACCPRATCCRKCRWPLSCEGWLSCSAFLWQCQLMPSAPAGALCIL